MFTGFKIQIDDSLLQYKGFGEKIYLDYKNLAEIKVKQYAINSGVISATDLENDWFPSTNAEIFISHSHRDQDKAIAFAEWLYHHFHVIPFIDSCVWGYADDLLRLIDNTYCVNKKKDDGTIDTYDYQKRNQSTAHVHMILNTALQKMIDKAECLIFLNTPNSITSEESIKSTYSPWIYSRPFKGECL